MCYAQMGGMMVATFITLLLVPVIYSIFVLELKLIKWDKREEQTTEESNGPQPAEAGLSRIVLDARMAKVAK